MRWYQLKTKAGEKYLALVAAPGSSVVRTRVGSWRGHRVDFEVRSLQTALQVVHFNIYQQSITELVLQCF